MIKTWMPCPQENPHVDMGFPGEIHVKIPEEGHLQANERDLTVELTIQPLILDFCPLELWEKKCLFVQITQSVVFVMTFLAN